MINDAIYIIAFIGAFLAIIITFFIITMLRYHRRYVKLQKDRVMNEIAVLENERKRITYDLHDGLGPMLSSIKLNINSIETITDEDKAIVYKASGHIDDAIKNRIICHWNIHFIWLYFETCIKKRFFEKGELERRRKKKKKTKNSFFWSK